MTAKADELYDPRTKRSHDPKHASVALPPGSFDMDALKKGLEGAAKAKPEDRDGKVEAAVREAAAEETLASLDADRSAIPGTKQVEVEHPEIEGLVETTKVFDAKAAEQLEAEPGPVTTSTTAGLARAEKGE